MAYQPHHSLQESQQVWDEAIGRIIQQISQQQNIQSVDEAIESLILTGGNYASPSVHALYLQKVPESKGFTRKDISKYLADLGEDHSAVKTYFQLVHFGRLSILDSLRLYYTELRLEPLMNKNQLNVLLTALATAFKTNGGNFNGDIEDCIRIYNAMIMLNDSLHSKNALGRSRQTEQGFLQIINDRTENVVKSFDEDEMRRIYQSIQKEALNPPKSKVVIEMKKEGDQNVNINDVQHIRRSYSSSSSSINDVQPIDDNDVVKEEDDNRRSYSSSSSIDDAQPIDDNDVIKEEDKRSYSSLSSSINDVQNMDDEYEDKRRGSTAYMNKIDVDKIQQQIDDLTNEIQDKNREIQEMKEMVQELSRSKIELVTNTNRSLNQMREFLYKYQSLCLV